MLRCHIVLISWSLATTIASTPPDSIKQLIDNNGNHPTYSYVYPNENDNGAQQGKSETKFDGLASREYYIDNNQSLAYVKYSSDEWGYHPIVEYSTLDDDKATSSAHLVPDNHSILEFINATDNTNRIAISTKFEANISSEYQSLESSQPPIINDANIYNESRTRINFVSNINNSGSINDTVFQRQEPKDIPVQYNTVMKSLNSDESSDPTYQDSTIPMYYSIDYLNSTGIANGHRTITENFAKTKNSEISDHRSQQNIIQQRNITNPMDPKLSYTKIGLTDDTRPAIQYETSSYNYQKALINFRKYLGLDVRIANVLNNSDEFRTFTGDKINSQIELPELSNDEKMKGPNSLGKPQISLEIKTFDKVISLKPEESVKFSRPIVVAEILNMDQPNYITMFPCGDKDTKSVSPITIEVDTSSAVTDKTSQSQVTPTLLETRTLERDSQITDSSMVLDPIQAGLAFVNVGQAHSMIGNVEPLVTVTVNETKFTENAPIATNQLLKNIDHDETSQLSNTLPITNFTLNQPKMTIKNPPHTPSFINDRTVEIQKSLELYHSAPIQEIHYPAQLMHHVTSIDQQQHQEPFRTTQKHENAKQKFQRDVELYKDDNNFAEQNGNVLKYQSIVNPSVSKLYELQTPSNGNNPTAVYVMDDGQKLNSNNGELIIHPLKNNIIQNNRSRIIASNKNLDDGKNIFIDAKLKTELYLPQISKNFYRINRQRELTDFQNEKFINHDMSIFQRLFTDNTETNDHHLKSDKLNYRDTNHHQPRLPSAIKFTIASRAPEYTNIRIDSTQQPIPIVNSKSERYTNDTSIIDNSITSTRTQIRTNNKSMSDIDDNTVYIHSSNMNSRINDIGNSEHQLHVSLEKFSDYPVDHETAMQTSSHPDFANRIIAKNGPYATQLYSVEKVIGETKNMMPYTFHKLMAHPYSVNKLQPYTVGKSTNIPIVTHENIVAKEVTISHESGSPVDIPKTISLPLEFTKYTKKSIQLPYIMQYKSNNHNTMDHHIHKFNDKHEVVNLINSPFSANISNQNSHDYIYVKPVIPFVNVPPALSKRYNSVNELANTKPYYQMQQYINYQYPSKKSYSSRSPFHALTTTNINNATPLPWPVIHRSGEKFINKNGRFLNYLPLAAHSPNYHHINRIINPIHHEIYRYSTSAPVTAASVMKRTKWLENSTGNFRQSKMEYGFKPLMIPSIQYDEQIAMEVEC